MDRGDQATRLRWALAATLVAVLPHVLHLPAWITVVVLALAGWRFAATFTGWRLPPRFLRLLLAIAVVLGVFMSYHTLNGLDAGSALVVGMLGMKLLETARPRDYLVLVFISYFLVVVNFLYSQSIVALAYSVPALWIITTALLQVTGSRRALAPRFSLGYSGVLLVQALPLTLLLFLLFPRVPGPLWGLPARNEAVSGLDDEMSPGTITRLSLSDATAFTVRFEGRPPPPDALYWRGPVLHRFDGRTWRAGWRNYASDGGYRPEGGAIRYEVTLEPHQRHWLFALDVPHEWPEDQRMTFDFQLVSTRPVTSLTRYPVTSWLDHRLDPAASERLLEYERALPDGRNPRTVAFASALRSRSANDREFVSRALAHFNNEPYVYTLLPPALAGSHPVDRFVFDTREGFCEHYASAFAVMMRAAGIPARIVTGYLGGERNPITRHLIVRQSDAHAWTEIWLDEGGWQRVDPTGAVAPERIMTGLAGAMASGEPVPGLFMRSHRWLNNLRYGMDAVAGMWNEFVLGYGPDAQQALLERLGIRAGDWRMLALLLGISAATVMAVLGFIILRQRPGVPREPAARSYDRFCSRVARRTGLVRAPAESPTQFAVRCARQRPDIAAEVAAITDLYLRCRYGPGDASGSLAALRLRVARFRPPSRAGLLQRPGARLATRHVHAEQ